MTRRKALNKYYVLRFLGIHILNETEWVPQPSSPALRTRLCTATGLSESWMPGGGCHCPPPLDFDQLTESQSGRAYHTLPWIYRPSYGPDQELLCLLEGCFDRIWETSLSNQLSRSSVCVSAISTVSSTNFICPFFLI